MSEDNRKSICIPEWEVARCNWRAAAQGGRPYLEVNLLDELREIAIEENQMRERELGSLLADSRYRPFIWLPPKGVTK